MERTARLLAILTALQAHDYVTAGALAERLTVSKRTIYRDMMVLGDSGIPITAEPGKGYSLVEGYFLPPLSFSSEEALMLVLGVEFAGRQFDDPFNSAAKTASEKILAALPQHKRKEFDQMRQNVRLMPGRAIKSNFLKSLKLIRGTILDTKQIQFVYQRRHPEKDSPKSARIVNPYGLILMDQVWYLTGYCHFRKAQRIFRISRITELIKLGKPFERPEAFDLARRPAEKEKLIEVKVAFPIEMESWVREFPSYYTAAITKTNKHYNVTLKVNQEEQVLQWIMGWGSKAKVIAPESMRRRIAKEINTLRTYYL